MRTKRSHIQSARIVFMWLPILLVVAVPKRSLAMDFYVSVDGGADADGSLEKPYGSLPNAVQAVRALRGDGNTEPAVIYLREGRHQLDETLVFGLEDGSPTAAAAVTLPQYGAGDKTDPAFLTFAAYQEVPRDPTIDDVRPYLHSHDNLIEYNEIHHAMEKLGDGNGIYIRGSGPGNVIRRSNIHHLVNPIGSQSGNRTDGGQMDTLIAENVIYRCTSQGLILKLNNRADNNIIAYVLDGSRQAKENSVSYLRLTEGPSTGGAIKHNIFYHPRAKASFFAQSRDAQANDGDKDYNIYYCAGNPEVSQSALDRMQREGVDAHSLAVDPMFGDPENGDFSFKPDSPALKLGITRIDLSKVGLLMHEEWRTAGVCIASSSVIHLQSKLLPMNMLRTMFGNRCLG